MAERALPVPAGGRAVWVRRHGALLLVAALLVALTLWAAVVSPSFRTPSNLFNVLRQSTLVGLAAVGQSFVILGGGIDLSVGAVAKLSTLLGALAMDGREEMTLPGVAAALAMGLAVGLANGLMVAKLRIAPFIATFGTFSVLRGVALTITTTPVGKASSSFADLYAHRLAGAVPVVVPAMAVVWLAAWLVLARTPFGRHVYAVGGQPQVARLAGIDVDGVHIALYAISGLLAAAAGLFTLSRIGVGDPVVGDGLELDSITAVVLGGVSLAGGRGSVVGVALAVLLLGLISNVFNQLQVDQWYQQLLKGIIIVAAVALYRTRR